MKITKFGHCCLLIEEKEVRILMDPGSYTTEQNNVKNINFILITHEHQDHFHLGSLKKILENNPEAKIITNNGVGALLIKENINFLLVEHGQSFDADGVSIEGFGEKHAEIYKTLPPVANTGYLIANRFFHPGDSLYNPGKEIEILAVPVVGPWMKLSEGIQYALDINPKKWFPIHEAILKDADFGKRLGMICAGVLKEKGIELCVPENNKEYEI